MMAPQPASRHVYGKASVAFGTGRYPPASRTKERRGVAASIQEDEDLPILFDVAFDRLNRGC